MRIVHVLGTRPNLVKMAPVIGGLRERFPEWPTTIVHTGQHYDRLMFEIFLEELGVPEPDHLLGVGSGSHAEQIARVLERLEPVLAAERPDLVVVPGDVNSTLGAALCAAKLGFAGRPPRVRAAQLRPGDARGDQPDRHRPPVGALLPALRRGDREPSRRGGPRRADEVRRQHDDRHPRRARGADPGAGGGASARPASPGATCSSPCTGRRSSTGPCSARRWSASRRSARELPGRCSRSIRARARCSTAPPTPGSR